MERSVCIDRRLLGTTKHLVVADDGFRWNEFVPKHVWHLDGTYKVDNDRCLDTVLRLSSKAPPVLLPPDRFVASMAPFSGSLGQTSIPWQKVMPSTEHRAFVKRLIDDVKVATAAAPFDYYEGTWSAGTTVIGALRRAAVDVSAWQELLAKKQGNVPALASFEPDKQGMATPVKYARFKTLTGRLTVESGPQILTLKREHRKIIRSIHGDAGSILSIDFAALEARVMLYEHGGRCDDVDLYAMIARELGYDRKAVKGAVISELYGSSTYALGKLLGIEGKELKTFVRKIKDYFSTSELLARIKQQFIETGRITNRYGRPIVIDEPLDHIFLNYYAQGTGVDVTMHGFKNIIERLTEDVPGARPIFLLHDAMLVDVHNDDVQKVRTIEHVKVPGYVQKYFVKIEKIS